MSYSQPDYFYQACLEVREWQQISAGGLTGLTVHRYPDDVWWVLWNDPRNGADLGRILDSDKQLRALLNGNLNLGKVLTLQTAAS